MDAFAVISGGNLSARGMSKRLAVQFDDSASERVARIDAPSNRQIADVALRGFARVGDAGLCPAKGREVGNALFEVHRPYVTAIAVERKRVVSNLYSGGSKMAQDESMSMGDRLKQARQARKLSQQRLATMSGVSQSTISDIERGRNKGSTEAARLASTLGVSALWLSTGRGPRQDEAPIRPVLPQKQLNTALLIQCMRAANAFQAQTGSKLDDDDLLRLACRLYEQHHATPDKTANELLGYLMTINDLLDSSHSDKSK